MKPRVVADDDAGRAEAIQALRDGGLVAFPTDTVYGIAVRLDAPGGVEALFRAKRRPPDRGIVLLLGEASQASAIGQWPRGAAALADAFWPGGLTIVVSQPPEVPLPADLTGGTDTIGLRVPDHSTPRAIARAVGPLPTTSANRSGSAEARTAAEIVDRFGDALAVVIDGGPARGAIASTVVDCSTPRVTILRAGAISSERIAAVLDAIGIAHGIA